MTSQKWMVESCWILESRKNDHQLEVNWKIALVRLCFPAWQAGFCLKHSVLSVPAFVSLVSVSASATGEWAMGPEETLQDFLKKSQVGSLVIWKKMHSCQKKTEEIVLRNKIQKSLRYQVLTPAKWTLTRKKTSQLSIGGQRATTFQAQPFTTYVAMCLDASLLCLRKHFVDVFKMASLKVVKKTSGNLGVFWTLQ